MTDDQLQESIESGDSVSSKDANAYRKVFSALQREPDFVLSASFSHRIVSQLARKRSSRDMFWLYMGLGGFVIALIVAIALTGFNPSMSFFTLGAFTFLSSYKGLIIFGIVFILLLQWIDRKFVQKTTELR